jgi:hypothetical protein
VTEVCSYRWQGPRVEVPDSVPVQHVCALGTSWAHQAVVPVWPLAPAGNAEP